MSSRTTKGKKRKLQDNASDISTSHDIVAPYEIYINALGIRNFLVSGYLFDYQSFTSLYNESLKVGWEKIFINEQRRLKKIKPNQNLVVKCLLVNRLLHQYRQDRNVFNGQVENLRNEIDSRMIYTFPQWKSEDLFREIRRWRDMQRRRHLFYFNYEGEKQMPNMPSFLMLQKAMTEWCRYLINLCQQDKNYWNNGGRARFIELFEHSFIIVAQPTGPDGAPVADYVRGNNRSSEKFAKINVRIICLLNHDILHNDVQLSNTGVTLCSLNRSVNNLTLEQTPIVWQTQQVTSADSGPISIRYAEVHNLILNNLYSRRTNTTPDLNLYELIFRTRIVVFDPCNKKNPMFESNTQLTSQPFGICSHSTYFPNTVAKVVYYEIEQISKNERKEIDPDILTDYTCRYQKRMLGVETKQHTTRYIKQVFSKAFEDVKNKDTTKPLQLLIERRLAQMISQIKFMVDYPVLSMMYDDSIFLGICNNFEVDKMLKGTPKEPQMLLRFEDLVCHQWNESPEIRCMIHNGALKKSTFSKKAFIDDMCRFIYESADNTAKQTTIFSYSDKRGFHNFQWYYNQLIPVLSKISLPGADDYKPLIPVLWQLRAKSEHHLNDNLHLQPNRVSTEFPSCSSSNLPNDPLTITYTVNQQELQNNSTAITFDVKMPVAVNIDPDVIVQYLKEKFQELCKIQDENIPQTDSIQSLQDTLCPLDIVDENIIEDPCDLVNKLYDDQSGPLRTPILQIDPDFDFLDDNIPPSG